MNVLQLTCKSCGKPVPAEDVNLDKALAKCRICHAVFDITEVVGRNVRDAADDVVPKPRSFTLENWGPELVLTHRWYSHGLWIAIPFVILWNGFLLLFFSVAIATLQDEKSGPAGYFMLLFSIVHAAVGVGGIYAVLCGFFNRTVIRVSGGELAVRHGPIPYPGNRQILTADIKQLYCTETIHRGKRSSRTTYNLLVKVKEGDKITLLSGLDDLDQGLYVEQQIEKYLGIQDKRVPGQVRI
jgi:hypothetical protein